MTARKAKASKAKIGKAKASNAKARKSKAGKPKAGELKASEPNDGKVLAASLSPAVYNDGSSSLLVGPENGLKDMRISFPRTTKVQDNSDTSFLPPDLGALPLFNAADLDGLPEELQGSSVLLPIHVREALWLNSISKEPYMLRVFTGGLNAVSGEAVDLDKAENVDSVQPRFSNDDDTKQDYMVVPNQPWLDGFASEPGKVKQFVAVPQGCGYSVEAQLTGLDLGGLMFLVTPLKPEVVPISQRTAIPGPAGLPKATAPPKAIDPPSDPSRRVIFLKGLCGQTSTFELSQTGTIGDLKVLIQNEQGVPHDQQRLIWSGKQLESQRSLYDYRIENFATFHLVLSLRGGGGGPTAMSIGAGGSIHQNIKADPYKPSDWDLDRTISIKATMINAPLLQGITGVRAPDSGPSASEYDGQYFALGDEDPPSTVKGDFEGVETVATLDEASDNPIAQAAAKIARRSTTHPVVRVGRIDDR